MKLLFTTLKKMLFWSYERGSWQYDLMCVLILAFVFFAPNRFYPFETHGSGDVFRTPQTVRMVPAAPSWATILTAMSSSLQRVAPAVASPDDVAPPVETVPSPPAVTEEWDAGPVGTGPASWGPLSHPARNAAMTMRTASALVMCAILRAARNPTSPRR